MLTILLFALPVLVASLVCLFIVINFYPKKLTELTARQKFSAFSALFCFIGSNACIFYALVMMAYRSITIVFIGPS